MIGKDGKELDVAEAARYAISNPDVLLAPSQWRNIARGLCDRNDELERTVRVLSRVQTELISERDALYAAIKALGAVASGDVWYWQGDGQDFPESFANNSHVVMTGAQARGFAAERAARKRAEAERDALLASGSTFKDK